MPWPTPLLHRNKKAHKNDFGHALIIAGSPRMLGASALCGLAAMRSGAGLTTLAIPYRLNLTLQKKVAAVLMTLPLPDVNPGIFGVKSLNTLKKEWNCFNSIAIGPGLGMAESTQKFVGRVLKDVNKPIVCDADALNALAKNHEWFKKLPKNLILTPHEGEMARLTGLKKEDIAHNRKVVAHEFSQKWNVTLVLKGYNTLVSSPEGKVYINKTGNVALATAGSGDVLTGIIVGFLAQGLDCFDAAKWGVRIHGEVADRLVKRKRKQSLIAVDLIEEMPYL